MKHLNAINALVKRCIKSGENIEMDMDNFDWMSGVGLYGLYKLSKDEALLKVCKDMAEFVVNDAARTTEGGLEHTVTRHGHPGFATPFFHEQIWADTLFMACIFLADMYKVTGEAKYRDEAIHQLTLHHNRLRDENTGVFYHGYNFEEGGWMSGALWARANAWITVATFEIIDIIGEDFAEKEAIISSVNRQIKQLSTYQRENGMFGTLLDHEDSYDESSATAGFAAGVIHGVKLGYVDDVFVSKLARRAIDAILPLINSQGELEQVSGGTPIMPTVNRYKDIPIIPTLYGQGLALMALARDNCIMVR